MNLTLRIAEQFADSADTKRNAADVLSAPLAEATEMLYTCVQAGGKVLICGNGGSAADAQHFAAEFVGRFELERRPLAALALTTDTSILTAVGNDYGYNDVFSRQVLGLGNAHDVLIAISTSGNSANIITAIEAAHQRGLRVIALTGKGGGKIATLLNEADIHLCVPAERTARIQEVHLLALHCLCDGVDALLVANGVA